MRAPKHTSPPSARIRSRIVRTTPASRSVPMCGFASMRISAGAPKRTNVRRMCSPRGSFVPVFSLPSEKVPAPPSPNCTLEAGEKAGEPCVQ